MNDAPIRLQFDKATPADKPRGRAPAEHYRVIENKSGSEAGTIRLRLSNDDDTRLYAGHIGYGIHEEHRGHHYAAYACLELKPIALERGFQELWITCNPDNWPSRRTCERIGAEFVEIADLPEDNDMYVTKGERQKCRYRWRLV